MYYCDQKAQVASAQNFTLQQQATIEITQLLLVRTTYIRVLFFAHIPFVVNRTFSTKPTKRLQQYTN